MLRLVGGLERSSDLRKQRCACSERSGLEMRMWRRVFEIGIGVEWCGAETTGFAVRERGVGEGVAVVVEALAC